MVTRLSQIGIAADECAIQCNSRPVGKNENREYDPLMSRAEGGVTVGLTRM